MCRKSIYLILFVAFAFSTMAMASDIAFYVGQWNTDGWYDASQFADVATIIAQTGHLFKDIQQFDDAQLAAFGTWVDDNTNDGEFDIIWLNGCMPSVLYPYVNLQPDGSRAELWLDGGNMIINVGDWFAYVSYETGVREPANTGTGAANILDLSAGIITSSGASMVPTAAGTAYLPSLNQVTSTRPVTLSEVTGDWEVAAIFAQNTAGTQADPVVIHNTVTDGYLAIINQSAPVSNWIADRGLTCAEFIGNWVSDVIGFYQPFASAPNPTDGATDVPVDANLSWTRGDYCIQDEVYFGTDPCALPLVATIPAVALPPLYNPPGDIIASTTYYWQVVETDSNMFTYPGPVWDFSTISGKAGILYPRDGDVIMGMEYLEYIYIWLDILPGPTADPDPSKRRGYFSDDINKVYNRDQDANLGPPPYYDEGCAQPAPDRFYVGLPASIYGYDPCAVVPTAGLETLVRGTTYYWACDEVDSLGNVFLGDIWKFTIHGYYAFEPSPPNEAIFVSPDVLLEWRAGYSYDEHDVYIGTSWADVNDARYNPYTPPPEFLDTVTEPNYQCSNLALDTKFYWRVAEVKGRMLPPIGGGTYYYGPVWSFTTRGANTGLVGEYYHHSGGASPAGFETKMLVRVDPSINFDFDADPPPGMRSDDFSVRWLGQLAVPYPGRTYTFTTETDDGVRLWVNDVLLIDQWIDQGPTFYSGSIYLDSFGPYDIKMEYYENGGGAVARLFWSGPGMPQEIIPSGYMAPTSEEAKKAFTAYNPYPRVGYYQTDWEPTLSWGPGVYAATHNLYFSTDFDDVNNRAVTPIVLTDPCYTPERLDLDQTYYWLVDEVNVAHPDSPWEGGVWSFTIPPGGTGSAIREWWFGIGGTGLGNLKNNASYPDWPSGQELVDIFEGPVDWADNYGSRIHGWLRPQVSGNYTFWIATDDNGELWLSTDEDPNNVQRISWVTAWAPSRAFDDPDVVPSSPIYLEAGKKYYIAGLMKEAGGGDNIAAAWQGPGVPIREVIDGQYLSATPHDPPEAYNPRPPVGAIVEDRTPTLSWSPGAFVQQINAHMVYFSDNRDDVNDRKPAAYKGVTTEPNYPHPPAAPLLELGQTYYWAIDEVNTVHPDSPWRGRLWSFTMAECIVLENAEDYNDRGEIQRVWRDGYTSVVWGGVPPYQYPLNTASSGSNLNVSTQVGAPEPPYTGPVYGGFDSMVLRFDNDGVSSPGLPGEEKWVYNAEYFSEIEANTIGYNSLNAGVDWDSEGVKSLTLWFTGHPISDGTYSDYDQTLWPEISVKVSGRGRDIQGRHDEFYFFGWYPYISGAGDITAQVTSMDNTHVWAKAGVMIREKMTPYSKYAAVFVTPARGVTFQYRDQEDGPTSTITEPGITAPQWLQLKYTMGGAFQAFHSSDGFNWSDVNSTTAPVYPSIPMGSIEDPNLHIGLAVSSHNADELCSADFKNVSRNPLVLGWSLADVGTNDPEQLYMALSDGVTTGVVNHPDVNAATVTDWQEWNILLTDFGVNLSNVEKVYIGLGDRAAPVQGGSGALYIDDVRACPPRCVPEFGKPLADIAGPGGAGDYDCIVDEKDLGVLAGDWLLRDRVITTSPPGDVNLAAHYEFEGNFNDSSVHARHASDPCGSNPGFDTGVVGSYALLLDGFDDHLVVEPNVGIDGNTPRTVAVWAKASVPAAFIVGWTPVFGFTSHQPPALGGRSFDIQRRGGQDFYCMHVYGWEENIIPLDMEWHHLAGTYDGGTIRWYGDGIPGGTNTTISTVRLIDTEDNVQVGKRAHDAGSYWPGLVDDARIYSRALTDGEIAYLATDGAGTLHIPIASPADLYQGEPQGSQWINLKDYSVITGSWLEEVLWP